MAYWIAINYVWCGMLLGVSFLEAPLKFHAPGVTREIGLQIGKLVFWALQLAQLALAWVGTFFLWWGGRPMAPTVLFAVASFVLVFQILVLYPQMARRTDAIVQGQEPPDSGIHKLYVAGELLKIGALVIGGLIGLKS